MINLVMSGRINIGNNEEELVHKYVYLGYEITISRNKQTCELRRRIGLECATYGIHVFASDLHTGLKNDQYVLPVLTYGAETLT